MAGAWFLEDEASPLADKALDYIQSGKNGLVAPALWYYELMNMLLVAERRKRLTTNAAGDARRFLDRLPLTVDALDSVSRESVYAIARTHGLSFYDATYLELAYRIDAPLITADKALRKATQKIKVKLNL